MAQVTITHFQPKSANTGVKLKRCVREAVGWVVYSKKPKQLLPEDLTIRTLRLENKASESGQDTEIHIEIASGVIPNDNSGNKILNHTQEQRFAAISKAVGENLYVHGMKGRIAIWTTGYPVTGWYITDSSNE